MPPPGARCAEVSPLRTRGGGGGGGTPPTGGGGGGGPGPERGLLTDATAGWRRSDLPTGELPGGDHVPPGYEWLVEQGRVRTDWTGFAPRERATAERLRQVGIDVVRVVEGPPLSGRSPDAAIAGRAMTVELKGSRANSIGSVDRAMRDARRQSRRLVLDVGAVQMSHDDAVTWTRAGLRRYGGGFDEVLVLGDGFGILWP